MAKEDAGVTIPAFQIVSGAKTMGKLYGLIFDVDGVIADTEAVNARASIRVFAELFDLHSVVREDFEAGLGRGAEKYVSAAAEVHGLDLTSEQVEEATRLRQEYFLKILGDEPLPPFPGVMELIRAAMQRENFRVAIATSGTLEKSRAVLEATAVPYRQMAYINGNDVTHKKPDPELFLLAAERIGVAPADCVVIEDAPNGVQAAKAAGAKCIAVTNSTTGANLSQADLVCDSLEQINLDIIQKLIDSS
ncbi:MAG: HAD family phosphatase [Planctomycetes bacterium]|nr:HAD family phosphatase [Planctomycetota bacterium]MBL7153870.1 HAD family phosphatase [Phycisphaerae bacterium]